MGRIRKMTFLDEDKYFCAYNLETLSDGSQAVGGSKYIFVSVQDLQICH